MDTLIDVGGVDFTKYALSPIQYVQWLKIGRLASILFFSSPEPKAQGELIVNRSSRCLSVCLWTFSNSNISATSGPIVTKFYLNHHWGGGKAALGFGLDRIGTLVSMATDSNENIHNISDEVEIMPDRTKDCGVSCP